MSEDQSAFSRGQPLEVVQASFLADVPTDRTEGVDSRRQERFPVQGTRPIAVRPLRSDGTPAGGWLLADILDISLGGMCLLITEPLNLERGQRLLLDVRSHRDFGVARLEGQARWWISSESFSTLGLCFSEQLKTIPKLELERRSVRRDPNLDDWASP